MTYALGWVAIRRASEGRTGFASVMLWIELAGVVTVGTLSLVAGGLVPGRRRSGRATASATGSSRPSCPIAGLLWLRAQDPARADRDGVVTAFRVVAFAEAASWFGLLVGMFFKYVVDAGEQGVQVFGPIHGTVFLAYVAITLMTWWRLRWSLPVALLALAASVPPFCTVLFERWAERTGRLAASGDSAQLVER